MNGQEVEYDIGIKFSFYVLSHFHLYGLYKILNDVLSFPSEC